MARDGFMNYSMMNWWGMGSGAFFMFIILIIVIVFTVLLLRRLLPADKAGSTRITPMEILEERFARGEIDETEFRKRRTELESGS